MPQRFGLYEDLTVKKTSISMPIYEAWKKANKLKPLRLLTFKVLHPLPNVWQEPCPAG